LGFGVAYIALILIFAGFMLPRWFNVLIPPQCRGEGKLDVGAGVLAETWMDQEQRAATEQAAIPASKEMSGNVNPPSKEEMPGDVASPPTKETRSSSSDTVNR
jgi:hypothetical protein